MTNLHNLLGINKNLVITVSIPASEYLNFCSVLEHKGYKTPRDSHNIPYNYLFIRHNDHFITKSNCIIGNNPYVKYTHAIPHTTILQYLTTNALKRIH